MADITLQNNQSLTLRLKACGLSNADIKKVLAALSPELDNKVDVDLENVTNEAFKNKADLAGVGGGGGSGDMLKAIYDTDGDGIVDNANNANYLGGIASNAYATYSSMYNYSYEKSEIDEKLNKKADNDFSNVSDEAFLAKLNAVLPDGDGVGY